MQINVCGKKLLRLEWDEVLFVLIVHFACYDVCNIHYCKNKTKKT